MNLPQNIQKTDGAIARSFSEELGLKLDLKTRRKVQLQSSEHIGGNPFLMKNNEVIVNINERNIIHIWSIADKCLLDCKKGPKLKISVYFKLNENHLLIKTSEEIGVIDINTGIYQSKFTFTVKPDDFIIDTDQKVMGILYYKEKVKELDIYEIETFQLINKIDCSGLPYQPTITFAKNSKVVCIENGEFFRIYDLSEKAIIQNIKIDTAKFSKFLDYRNPGIVTCQGQGSWVYEFKTESNIYKPVFEYGYGVSVSKDFLMTFTSGTGFVKLATYNIHDYNQIGSTRIIGAGVNNLNFSNGHILGYRTPYQKPGCIFVYDKNLNEITAIDYSISLNLHQFSNKTNLFGFIKAVFDINNEKLYKFRERIPHELKGNWVNSGYHVRTVDIWIKKEVYVVFDNIITHETHQTRPFKYSNSSHNILSRKISIEYLEDDDLWLFKIADEYYILYDAKTRKEQKPVNVVSNSLDKILFIDKQKYVLKNTFYYSGISSPKSKLQLQLLETGEIVSEYFFNTSSDLSFNYFLNQEKKSIILIEFSRNDDTNKYELWCHLFDYKLNKLKADIIHYYTKDIVRLTDAKYNEQNNCLFFKGVHLYDYKLYKLDLNTYKIDELLTYEEYTSGRIVFSPDSSVIAMATNKGIYIIEVDTCKQLGLISSGKIPKYFFCSDGQTIVVQEKSKTDFYNINPVIQTGSMYVEMNGEFYVEILPDKTSPNGWFYTNTPDKVKILKTKADGSEPELLPVENEERQAFIKHHNRKDIVLNKLFNSDKYDEFARLNAGALESAKNDMAIELGKANVKKIEKRK